MHWFQLILEHSVLARLFAIIALGYVLGEIRLPGRFRFGIAAVLFVGMALGAWSKGMILPEEIQTLGLVLFVYCVGLEAAPGFFQSFKSEGLKCNLAVLLTLLLAFGITLLAMQIWDQPKEIMAGLFCGALTNTPALGAVSEWIGRNGGQASSAVGGYGVVYPFAVFAVLLFFQTQMARARKGEEEKVSSSFLPDRQTIEIQHLDGKRPWTVGRVMEETGLVLSRCRFSDGTIKLVSDEMELPVGVWVVATGDALQLSKGLSVLGRLAPEPLHKSLKGFEVHRYFVSNEKLAGRKLRDLDLKRYGAVINRLRRGDVDLPVSDDTVLHLGDRVRVVSYNEKEPEIRKLFGNSLKVISETGYFSFAIGIFLGLLLGQVAWSIPGLKQPLQLGIAGGPLIVALILGWIGRSGPVVWNIPMTVNLTIRHFGILLFLAGAGVKAGANVGALIQSSGMFLITFGVSLTLISHLVLTFLLKLFHQRHVGTRLGVGAGFQTQPAALTFATARLPSGPLTLAYASVYPLSMVLKVLLAQLLLMIH